MQKLNSLFFFKEKIALDSLKTVRSSDPRAPLSLANLHLFGKWESLIVKLEIWVTGMANISAPTFRNLPDILPSYKSKLILTDV